MLTEMILRDEIPTSYQNLLHLLDDANSLTAFYYFVWLCKLVRKNPNALTTALMLLVISFGSQLGYYSLFHFFHWLEHRMVFTRNSNSKVPFSQICFWEQQEVVLSFIQKKKKNERSRGTIIAQGGMICLQYNILLSRSSPI